MLENGGDRRLQIGLAYVCTERIESWLIVLRLASYVNQSASVECSRM